MQKESNSSTGVFFKGSLALYGVISSEMLDHCFSRELYEDTITDLYEKSQIICSTQPATRFIRFFI